MRLVVQFRFKGLLWSNVCCISRNWHGWILSKHLLVLSCRKGGICWSVVLRSKLRERFDKITRCSLKIQQCIYRVRSLGGVGRRSRLGMSSRGSISARVTKVALCSKSAAQTGCGHSGTWEILCTGASWAENAEMESGMGWSKCTSKETTAGVSTRASALLCPHLQSQRRNRSQNALWSFSGLADAKRQRCCSLPEPECFYSEGGRGAFPLSLTLKKAGKRYCAGNWVATGNVAHSQTP